MSVSTSPVVIVTLCDPELLELQSDALAVHADVGEVAAGGDDLLADVERRGMPTASMATSTPLPPVSAMTLSTALPSSLFTAWVAPNLFATSSRLSSRSTMMTRPANRTAR